MDVFALVGLWGSDAPLETPFMSALEDSQSDDGSLHTMHGAHDNARSAHGTGSDENVPNSDSDCTACTTDRSTERREVEEKGVLAIEPPSGLEHCFHACMHACTPLHALAWLLPISDSACLRKVFQFLLHDFCAGLFEFIWYFGEKRLFGLLAE
jgi:hypothetical protein